MEERIALKAMTHRDSTAPTKQQSSIPRCGGNPTSILKMSRDGKALNLAKYVSLPVVRMPIFFPSENYSMTLKHKLC